MRQARRQLGTVLVLAVLYNLPRFFTFRVKFEPHGPNNATMPNLQETELNLNTYYNIGYNNIAYLIFLLLGPLLILGVLNYMLIRALAKMRKKRATMQSAAQQQDNSVTLVLVVLVVIFIVCELPALVQQILRNVLHESSLICGGFLFYLRPISNVLVTANSAVNFFVYVTFNTRFRQLLVEMVFRRRHRMGSSRTIQNGSADYKGASYSRVPVSKLPLSTGNNGLKIAASDMNTLSDCDAVHVATTMV